VRVESCETYTVSTSFQLGALRKESKDIEYGSFFLVIPYAPPSLNLSPNFPSHFAFYHPYAVFINAPHILLPSEMHGSPTQFDSVAQGEMPSEADTQADPSLALRAWWEKPKEGMEAKGLKESIMYLRDVLREGRYDVSYFFLSNLGWFRLLIRLFLVGDFWI
jgi:hypothetical protein